MPVRFTVTVEGPVEPEDLAVLNGAAMLLFALAHQDDDPPAEEPEQTTDEPPEAPGSTGPSVEELAQLATMFDPSAATYEEQPCGKPEDGTDRVCMGKVGHRGRHLYRHSASPLAN